MNKRTRDWGLAALIAAIIGGGAWLITNPPTPSGPPTIQGLTQPITYGTHLDISADDVGSTNPVDEVLLHFEDHVHPLYFAEGRWHANINSVEGVLVPTLHVNGKEVAKVEATFYQGPQDYVRLSDDGQAVVDGAPWFPAGFNADYRTRWAEYDRLLEAMRPYPVYNLLRVQTSGGISLHDGVPPGHVNETAAANLQTLLDKCAQANVRNWLVLWHRGGAGGTVPFIWTEFDTASIMRIFHENPWSVRQGGPLSHPSEAYRPEYYDYWKSLMRHIVARWAHSPNLAVLELTAEAYLMDGFRYHQQEFEDWQRMLRSYLDTINPYKTLIATGDGSDISGGAFAPEGVADLWSAHMHPPRKKLRSKFDTESLDGIFSHRDHPQLAHTGTLPYWNGALGYGQYAERLSSTREEFGRIRTALDQHAIAEYMLSGGIGSGLPWDHEGWLGSLDAPGQYASLITTLAALGPFRGQATHNQYGSVRMISAQGLTATVHYIYDADNWDSPTGQYPPVSGATVPARLRSGVLVNTQTGQQVDSVSYASEATRTVTVPRFERSILLVARND